MPVAVDSPSKTTPLESSKSSNSSQSPVSMPIDSQRFVSTHGQIANLFLLHRKDLTAADHRQLRDHAISTWREIALSIGA
ncbi:hypothetical protein J2046_005927 [Rhizobium petrolearium]|nr:hypothetical protein [Neorhizobium petrolearium]